MERPDLIIRVKVLNENEGGRKTSFFNGYRGQLNYNNSDWDATYNIIGKSEAKPGEKVELELETLSKEIHFGKFEIGKVVKIREGSRIVATGNVSKILNQKFENWDLEKFQLSKMKLLQPYTGDLINGYKKFLKFYLENENYFESIDIIESEEPTKILIIKLLKKENSFAKVYQFVAKKWKENLKLEVDRLRIDYELDELSNLKKMIIQFATWGEIEKLYMSGEIIIE